MSVRTRWVQYSTNAAGEYSVNSAGEDGVGTRGYRVATASVGDKFQIGTTNNTLYVQFDGYPVSPGYGVVISSGTDLDPRFVAKELTEGFHNSGQGGGFDFAQCVWEDGAFKIYSGTLGNSSSVTVNSGTNTAHLELGFGTWSAGGGLAGNTLTDPDNYITVSGVYNGFFDEVYRIVITRSIAIGTPVKQSGDFGGTITVGGVYNNSNTVTYTITINTTGGYYTNAGTGNVPTMSWVTDDHNDDGGPTELLYADYWYRLGTRGVMVKFSNDYFNNDSWTIDCTGVEFAEGTNESSPKGQAKYIWGSTRGDDASSPATTQISPNWGQLGSRGLSIQFDTSDPWPGANLTAGDEFYVVCKPPQPSAYDITNLNYGNVTVSTESPLRVVMFEIMGGDDVSLIDTVKFGLQSHGNFEHHGSDTFFRFGTVGPGNNAGTFPEDGYEWYANVTSADINDPGDTPPTWLYATKYNLEVVADADSSEDIGVSTYAGMVTDPMWLNIKLGQSEVGANSTINYRIYFDYQ